MRLGVHLVSRRQEVLDLALPDSPVVASGGEEKQWAELNFDTEVVWEGAGRDGRGEVAIGGQMLEYSSPAPMGGRGTGTSPEELLVSAVGSCYTGTLFAVLVRAQLPVKHLRVQAHGLVTGWPAQGKFSRIVVVPTIFGADATRRAEYEASAVRARDKCFIGRGIAGNVA